MIAMKETTKGNLMKIGFFLEKRGKNPR